MRTTFSPWLIALLAVLAVSTGRLAAAEEDGVALAIVYDTSGSMNQPVPGSDGQSAPKYVIANRALLSITRQIKAYSEGAAGGSPRKVNAALFIFNGPDAREVIKFGAFNASAFEKWVNNFSTPKGGTPLGNALSAAARVVLNSPKNHKHVLVITDGISNVGPGPVTVMRDLKREAESKHCSLSLHFVAFDIDAKRFDGIRKQGATVVGAADEKQLDSQLKFILERKILLEEEERPTNKN